MNFEIKHLSEHITPETSGIIWLTDDFLDYSTAGVYEFNYLLNGMLLKTISQTKEESRKPEKSNFFLGDSFGNPLFIGHAVVKNKDDIKTVYNHFQIATPLIQKKAINYLFNRSKNTANINVLQELAKKFPEWEFKNLNI